MGLWNIKLWNRISRNLSLGLNWENIAKKPNKEHIQKLNASSFNSTL